MKSKNLILMVIALIGLNSSIMAQQKYAILIGGDPLATGVPIDHKWNNGQYPGPLGYDEIWNDTYLMWELLYLNEYGYTDENIHVFFKDGLDYTFEGQDYHYQSSAHQVDHITDMMAKKSNVMDLLTTLQTTITANDYLFIWIMSHGGNTTGGDSYIYLRDYATGTNELLYDYELNQKLDLIPAMKKVVIVQAPNSGGFAEKLAASNVIVLTSSDKNEPAGRADNIPFTENETWGSNVYHHGEFGFHLYSPLNGESPAGNTSYGTENFNIANANEDDVVSLGEGIGWLNIHHSTSEVPVSSDIGNIRNYTSHQFPTLIFENITTSVQYNGIVAVTAPPNGSLPSEVNITGGNITFSNSIVIFLEETRLINFGGVLNIGTNTIMKGYNAVSALISGSEINFTPGNLFHGETGAPWGGVLVSGVSINLSQVTFQDCHLVLWANPTTHVHQSDFIRSGIKGYNMGDMIDISSNNDFINSFCELGAGRSTKLIINDCDFLGPVINYFGANTGIFIKYFSEYQIVNCNVRGYMDGIYIMNCNAIPDKDLVVNNSIYNNSAVGIRLSGSSTEILNNIRIYTNNIGIVCSNNSNVKIIGNELATNVSQTQRIYDNTVNQIYGSYNSFPYLKWNGIWSDNNANCLVKWDIQGIYPNLQNISDNFWGPPPMFEPNVDLCPTNAFVWLPIWALQYDPKPKEADEELYDAAVLNSKQGNYAASEFNYKQIIASYPESKFAESSLKQLLPLEKYLNNNYTTLKMYYQNDTNITNNEYLSKVGNYLSAWCDVESENFPASIEYFENVLDSPPCFQDSIFAIIDLGFVYFLMDDGLKSSYTGRYSEYKFKTKDDYNKNTYYLLSLIDEDISLSKTMKRNISTLKSGELLQNVPNPFNGSTQIWFKLTEESNVNVTIYDYTGKEVSVINPGSLKSGNHSVEFNSANLSAGIYFYSLEVNGIETDTKKMTLTK